MREEYAREIQRQMAVKAAKEKQATPARISQRRHFKPAETTFSKKKARAK